MEEQVGKVRLDYKYYPGEDLYSDGKIEDMLLEIASRYEEEELNQVIADSRDWSVLYHMSHIRQNIIDWFLLQNRQRYWKSAPAAERSPVRWHAG